ncbi:hypothetical protein [Pseudocnuella soli]|uniref:hypothetical protein n=1 Tax=Pseudocnuella soli TaxID=2502779 RepID=UPI001047D497|nr:hypothetical protein [Pseudocnuella soli]
MERVTKVAAVGVLQKELRQNMAGKNSAGVSMLFDQCIIADAGTSLLPKPVGQMPHRVTLKNMHPF